jgi:hypothetical protein
MSAETTYVVMIGQYPTAAASSLEDAQADGLRAEQQYLTEGTETRWAEHRPGKEWRLMSRAEGRRRFSWTQRWVAAVPTVEDGAQ